MSIEELGFSKTEMDKIDEILLDHVAELRAKRSSTQLESWVEKVMESAVSNEDYGKKYEMVRSLGFFSEGRIYE